MNAVNGFSHQSLQQNVVRPTSPSMGLVASDLLVQTGLEGALTAYVAGTSSMTTRVSALAS